MENREKNKCKIHTLKQRIMFNIRIHIAQSITWKIILMVIIALGGLAITIASSIYFSETHNSPSGKAAKIVLAIIVGIIGTAVSLALFSILFDFLIELTISHKLKSRLMLEKLSKEIELESKSKKEINLDVHLNNNDNENN
ncbi:hypothetical protein DMC14_000290 [Metamycoplasma phocicerebrale]|uniref:DUF4282 domain-containing protein n=1 Tax=Metamycoplasma phocicerebrale TaxID=142649 RepID=A0A3Q9V9Y0_9BACT|nr:hypothetical protein [Metamycoplasma phocicerebrale]AZZ65249.1 hypothetical protein DMC14_000290 [Metamycoplasma phocicerebrale]